MSGSYTAVKGGKSLSPSLPFQTIGEEIANSVIHGLGALLAVAGLVLLVLKGNGYLSDSGADSLAVTAYIIFTVTMILMFLASTLYHAIQHRGAKRIFRVLDHSAIYLLIAGTYTPFCLLALRGSWGWYLFIFEWALAAIGITLYALNVRFYKKIELIVYVLMGWAIVLSWVHLVPAISFTSLVLLVGGGIAYTLGIFWFARPKSRGSHIVWHIFVLIGAISHWLSIWFL